MQLTKPITYLFAALMLVMVQSASAALTIDITEGVDGALPIAVVPFDTSSLTVKFPVDLAQIVASDLNRSGVLKSMDRAQLPATPHYSKQVQYARWRNVGAGLPGRWSSAGEVTGALYDRISVAGCAQAKAAGRAQHARQETQPAITRASDQ
jgi:Tol biopolymer transport system component